MRYTKINEGVYVSFESIDTFGSADREALIWAAEHTEKKRSRINFHQRDDDPVHEMIVALCRGTKVPIHKHTGKTESLHIMFGYGDVVTYEDNGDVRET